MLHLVVSLFLIGASLGDICSDDANWGTCNYDEVTDGSQTSTVCVIRCCDSTDGSVTDDIEKDTDEYNSIVYEVCPDLDCESDTWTDTGCSCPTCGMLKSCIFFMRFCA